MNRWCSMYWKIVMAIILMKTIEPPIISMAFPSNSNGSVYVICTSFKIPRYCMCLQSPVATPPGTTQRTSSAWKKVGSHGFHWWPFFKHSILLCSVPLKTWRPISFMLMTNFFHADDVKPPPPPPISQSSNGQFKTFTYTFYGNYFFIKKITQSPVTGPITRKSDFRFRTSTPS